MAVALSFPSVTPHFGLPLLFSGQAQKEFFLNQSLTLIDALLQQSVLDSLPSPPASPADGDTYRVTSVATAEWAGQEDRIAVRVGGDWLFLEAKEGMRLFDREHGAFVHFNGQWESPVEPSAPSGGGTIDAEARQMLNDLVEVLRKTGVFANPS